MATCNEDGCQVLVTGKCINNLPLDTCPHYTDKADVNDSISPNAVNLMEELESMPNEEIAKKDYFSVYSGAALSIADANKIAAKNLTRLIILAGMPYVGKTTVPLTIMDLLTNNESFADHIFAASRTLLEFEERSHPSKIASERSKPETPRTIIDNPKFLHLKVAPVKTPFVHLDLLFTDISGETFVALKNNDEFAREFQIALRADHFTLFFDTDAITDLRTRANTKTNGLGILRSLTEAEVLMPYTNIQIVFSRWDYLLDKEADRALHDQYIAILKRDINKIYAEKFKIEFFEIAARPRDLNKMPLGSGLDQIFKSWIDGSIIESSKNILIGRSPASSREFLKYRAC